MLSDRLGAASLAGLLSFIPDVASLAWQTTTLTDVPTCGGRPWVRRTLDAAAECTLIGFGVRLAFADKPDSTPATVAAAAPTRAG